MGGVTRGQTRKLYQLLGEGDRQYPERPQPRTWSQCRLYGADVGAVLDLGDRGDKQMRILFGDSWTGTIDSGALRPTTLEEDRANVGTFFRPPYGGPRPFNADAVGLVPLGVTADNAHEPFELDFARDPGDGAYATLEVPGVNMLTNCVPTGAIPVDDGALVFVSGIPFFQDGHRHEQRSWIAPWRDLGRAKTEIAYEFSKGPFANFAFPVVAGGMGEPVPPGEPFIWLWGTAVPNRGSAVRLGRARLEEVARSPQDRGQWEFFAGLDSHGEPRFSDEAAAVPLFDTASVGELSVCWSPHLDRWLLLHNSNARPRGIVCRSAPRPWGPWDDGVVIFDPRADDGYGHFIHEPGQDQVSDPGREQDYGGEYAPIVIPRLSTGAAGRTTIRYLMSTWNPYTVVMMESELSSG